MRKHSGSVPAAARAPGPSLAGAALALSTALLAATSPTTAASAELTADEVRARIAAGDGPARSRRSGSNRPESRGRRLPRRRPARQRAQAGRPGGADLTGANLDLVILRDANLKGARLADVSAFQAVFSGGDLTGADLSGAEIVAKFERTNLAGANSPVPTSPPT